MKRSIYIVFVGLVLLLSACGGSTPQVSTEQLLESKSELPSWYENPPASDGNVLYGVGEGVNKDDAVAHALSDILARLNVSISSSFSSKKVVREGSATSSVDAVYVDKISSIVQTININSYDIVAYKKLGFKKYAALVKVDKKEFARALQKDIQRSLQIASSLDSLQGVDALHTLQAYKKRLKALEGLENKLAVLSELKSDVDEQYYLQKYAALQKSYEKLRQSITFWIIADFSPLAEPLKKGLTKEQFVIENKHDSKHFDIYIKTDITKSSAYGFIIARANVTLTTKESKKKIIATNSLLLVGRSSQSFVVAKQDLVKSFNEKIQEEGIFKILGLDI
jgi:hypothetical protein